MISWFGVADIKGQDHVSLQSTATHLLYSEQLQQYYLIDVFLPKGYKAKESELPVSQISGYLCSEQPAECGDGCHDATCF